MKTRARNATASILLVCGLFSFQGCVFFPKVTQKVPVTSHPVGAWIIVDGKEAGQTPLNLTLKKNRKHTIRLEMDGFQPTEIIISRNITPRMLVSLLYVPVMAAGGLMGSFLYLLATDPEATRDWDRTMTTVTLVGGALGALAMIGDITSGANHKLDPRSLEVTMKKSEDEGSAQVQVIRLTASELEGLRWISIKTAGSGDIKSSRIS